MEPVMLKLAHPELDEALSRAFLRVEHYLCALRIRNKRVLHELTHLILERVRARLEQEPGVKPEEAVMEEIERHVSGWYARVAKPGHDAPENLATAARLSLFNANLPDKWSQWFLREGPWPEAFVTAMQKADLRAHPKALEGVRMKASPLDLGTVGEVADSTWKLFGKWPLLGMASLALAYLGVLGFLLYFTA